MTAECDYFIIASTQFTCHYKNHYVKPKNMYIKTFISLNPIIMKLKYENN